MKKVKYFLTLILSLLTFASTSAQTMESVAWSCDAHGIEDDYYMLEFTAVPAMGWHMYDMGEYSVPVALEFQFEPSEDYILQGGVGTNQPSIRKWDEFFEEEIGYYEDKVVFKQEVEVKEGAEIKVKVLWKACQDGGNCVDGSKTFTISVGNPQPKAAKKASGSLWGYVLTAIGWALFALLTPCVFPMIPMTVSYFMKGAENPALGRFRAAMYGLFIVLLYTLPIAVLILMTYTIGGNTGAASIFNWLATHWLPNVIFFAVFMIFAASFFGAFEIVMPEKLVNKSDEKADKGGLLGIFFMALTLVLVSFSCTGPIIGSVLIQSTSGEVWTPIITMAAFAIVFALPFTLFALFPSWLKRLPKSGGWLNSVKVVLGFVELALGLKFLSVADMTYGWRLLDREVYLALWIVIFSLLGMYLLGKLRFKHDSEVKHISVLRLLLSIASFSFVVYMVPGMWGAPLSFLSGYLPPMETQEFRLKAGSSFEQQDLGSVKYSEYFEMPHELQGFYDMEQAKEYAQRVDKPIFVDITGKGCVNCRNMEAKVWADPRVLKLLREEYVIVALYMDVRENAYEEDWLTRDGEVLKTIGEINTDYVLRTYGVNSQPYYILQDSEGVQLVEPRAFDLDVDAFVKFLEDGIDAYRQR
ncbi:MAG: thioredoxin family protein [Alistipes sp.]|nr:thioredoxin family protein [Alistipes sp.]